MSGDFIYWTDVYHNSVNRALRSDGSEYVRILTGQTSVSGIKVIRKADTERRGKFLSNNNNNNNYYYYYYYRVNCLYIAGCVGCTIERCRFVGVVWVEFVAYIMCNDY